MVRKRGRKKGEEEINVLFSHLLKNIAMQRTRGKKAYILPG